MRTTEVHGLELVPQRVTLLQLGGSRRIFHTLTCIPMPGKLEQRNEGITQEQILFAVWLCA